MIEPHFSFGGEPNDLPKLAKQGRPFHVKNFTCDAPSLLSAVSDCFARFPCSTKKPRVRVFEGFSQNFELSCAMQALAKPVAFPLEEWFRQDFGLEEDFCVSVNGISAWSSLIHDFLVEKLIHPLISGNGRRTKPFDAYMFCGCYGLTPFGVHTDGEDSILVHLGPAEKRAMVWETLDISSLGEKRFAPDALVEPDLDVVLNPGDLIYIPASMPHAMANGDFSVTLGLIPNPSTANETLFEILTERFRELAGNGSIDGFQNTRDGLLLLASRLGALDDRKKLLDAFDSVQDRLESNGWLVPSPVTERMDGLELPEALRSHHLYPIRFHEFGHQIRVYVRGYEFILPNEPSFLRLLSEISNGVEFMPRRQFDALDENCSPAAARRFILEVYRHHGLSLQDWSQQ